MAVADAQAHYDPLGGETSGYITPQDAKNAIAQIYTDMAAVDNTKAATTYVDSGLALKADTTYVNTQNGLQDTAIAAKVARSGDTMTGQLGTITPVASGDAANKGYVDSTVGQHMPLGAIIMWGGSSAPSGWHLCDGTAHSSSALQAIIGSTNTPDLRDRFVVGSGSTYANGNTGGAASVTLTTAQMPAHSHGGTVVGAGAHEHVYNDADQRGDQYGLVSSAYYQGTVDAGGKTAHNTYNGPGNHAHTINSDGSGGSHENRPPYYALTFIIKKV
jgi:microcystin-dependent protein